MIHKVKDVVTKFLHPSFLFSAAGAVEPARSVRSIDGDVRLSEN